MKFKKYQKLAYADMEKSILAKWKSQKTFEKSISNREDAEAYVFYDGPPFITGLPHHGNLLPSVAKDVVPRYQTMKGYKVERRWGWDCHGLPAENFVEKKLGLKDKAAVLEYGLDKYITTCRQSMTQVGSEWEDTIDRIGRWVEFKGAYKTMDPEYMESIWWAFKELYDKDKIYEGEKVLMYCTRCATPVSKAEIAMDNSYQDVTDPSVYVLLDILDEDYSLLAWTTTPWTLHSNTASAVNKDLDYSVVLIDGKKLVIATDTIAKVLTDEKHNPLDYELISNLKGSELVGKRYKPLFEDRGDNAHKVLHADYVNTDEGTGIVHLAPAYGEEDYELAQLEDIPMLIDIDENGAYTSGPWKGAYVWEVNKQIAKELKESGVVWKIDYITHSYPHCHRCNTKLMYRAHPSWFMNIRGQKKDMLESNKEINWFPEHIKRGRFNNIIKTAPDWNLSRDRFWATPLPVWRSKDDNGKIHTIVVGSYAELEELSGKRLDDYHRPWVDEIEFEHEGRLYKRIDKVIDCWFESGSMPFAQYHYPFENKQKFEDNFPGDFIVEYVGQVRAWFYYLHAVSMALFDKPSFKNVIVTGTVSGNDGRKMSKQFGNYTDPILLVDTYSADAYRTLLMSAPVMQGEDFSLVDKDVADMQRKLNTLQNTLEFFLLYAEADNWEYTPSKDQQSKESDVVLDRWIKARLAEVTIKVQKKMDAYDIPSAVKPWVEFIDDLSNWYVRRSRRRFWKSDSDDDKENAYRTLHSVLLEFSKVVAPFAPFIAEEIYGAVGGPMESVHLEDWPAPGELDKDLTDSMARTRRYVTEGLSERSKAQIKVRQPLSEVTITDDQEIPANLIEVIAEELNVKHVHVKKGGEYSLVLDTTVTENLKKEGFVREVVRRIQESRKVEDLDVSDHIYLEISTEDKWAISALTDEIDYISNEVLANDLVILRDTSLEEEVATIMDIELGINVKKA